jgi:hypothetical protein
MHWASPRRAPISNRGKLVATRYFVPRGAVGCPRVDHRRRATGNRRLILRKAGGRNLCGRDVRRWQGNGVPFGLRHAALLAAKNNSLPRGAGCPWHSFDGAQFHMMIAHRARSGEIQRGNIIRCHRECRRFGSIPQFSRLLEYRYGFPGSAIPKSPSNHYSANSTAS